MGARRRSHSDLLAAYLPRVGGGGVFVEVGVGPTTARIAEHARATNGRFYACDINEELIREVQAKIGPQDAVIFMQGDSEASLKTVADKEARIDFAFLDGAASALKTFGEFQTIEAKLNPGAVVVIDNASLPDAQDVRSPCRKGKILVPYLLAHPHWEVFDHPQDGDSMIAAIMHEASTYSDPRYEHPEYVDQWRSRVQRM